jgi:hypothetical protein
VSTQAAPPPSGRDPEADYYQSIEEYFVSRRGDPLFLSNADWVLIRSWREAGLPLRVVLRGVADAMDSHAHSWSRNRKVGSLRYCGVEVEAAAERWRRALAGGQEETAVDAVLLGMAASLRAADLGPHARAKAEVLSGELEARAALAVPGEELERWLRGNEVELVAAIDMDRGADDRRALEAEVEADLAAYRERLPARVLAQVRAESLVRRLLDAYRLPRFSLWSL